jgi:hypothetical protein
LPCIGGRSATLWTATPVRLEQMMASQIDLLMEKLQQVHAEIEIELAEG